MKMAFALVTRAGAFAPAESGVAGAISKISPVSLWMYLNPPALMGVASSPIRACNALRFIISAWSSCNAAHLTLTAEFILDQYRHACSSVFAAFDRLQGSMQLQKIGIKAYSQDCPSSPETALQAEHIQVVQSSEFSIVAWYNWLSLDSSKLDWLSWHKPRSLHISNKQANKQASK